MRESASCRHYRNYEGGEACQQQQEVEESRFCPSEIIDKFLYLGCFNHAFDLDMLKFLEITHVLNTFHAGRNLHTSDFNCYRLSEKRKLQFHEAINFIDFRQQLMEYEQHLQQPVEVGVFPTEVLKHFLYLGCFNHASNPELLKLLGITHVLNTFHASRNLYTSEFKCYHLTEDKTLQFDEANNFIEQCKEERGRVLVYCVRGKNRSAAIVIGYLTKYRGWNPIPLTVAWLRVQRPEVEISPDFMQQLLVYEQTVP